MNKCVKVGNIITSDKGNTVEVLSINGETFHGKVIVSGRDTSYAKGMISTEWRTYYIGWTLSKKHNTPLWKVLNGCI